MKPSELFDLWAPPAGVWSRWAKPVLFAELDVLTPIDVAADALPRLKLHAGSNTAVVVDLPGALSVKTGLALLEMGFRPVPLYNGNRGPTSYTRASALVNNEAIIEWLCAGTTFLQRTHLPFDVPPAFLLDSRRKAQVSALPGQFDNRWIVFPQDFPSANFLRAQGITQVWLVQSDSNGQPQEDLAHVLRRWQEAGLALFISSLETEGAPQPLRVDRPSRFCKLWYTMLAIAGLRRNSAGGFGSVVPQPSSGG